MKKIELISITLENFKGIKSMTIDFSKNTKICGKNGTGKSTIFDAFYWLLFGKDHLGNAKFEIQTLDSSNNVIHGLTHRVTACMSVNDKEHYYTRMLEEKWVKQRGQVEKELKGTVTTYEIDDVPLKQKDFQEAVNNIIDEKLFKVITNPYWFSSMDWKSQRSILINLDENLSDADICNYDSDLENIKDEVTEYGIDGFMARTKASVSKLKDEIKGLPFRIDELHSQIIEDNSDSINKEINDLKEKLEDINSSITGEDKKNSIMNDLKNKLFDVKHSRQDFINDTRSKRDEPLFAARRKVDDCGRKFNEAKDKELDIDICIKGIDRKIKDNDDKINSYISDKNKFAKKWIDTNAEEFKFDDTLTRCPTCGREYDNVDEIKKNALLAFEDSKKHKLKDISDQGFKVRDIIDDCRKHAAEYDAAMQQYQDEASKQKDIIKDISKDLDDAEKEYHSLKNPIEIDTSEYDSKIDSLEAEISSLNLKGNIALNTRKRETERQIEALYGQLQMINNNANIENRIAALMKKDEDLNNSIALMEGKQYLGEKFIRTKVELLEGNINKRFEGIINFKLFSNQVNGGISETCTATINGVPYWNANTAAQINAGLSIIEVLSNHFNVSAPVFVDNAEAVNTLENIDGQLIKLYVTEDSKLKVMEE